MLMLDTTKQLLDEALSQGLFLTEIADVENVDYEWLKKFAAGKIEEPGTVKLEHLHNRLAALKRARWRLQ